MDNLRHLPPSELSQYRSKVACVAVATIAFAGGVLTGRRYSPHPAASVHIGRTAALHRGDGPAPSQTDDARGALSVAVGLLGGPVCSSALYAALGRLAKLDPGAALVQLEALPPGEDLHRAIAAVAIALAPSDPAMAALFAAAIPAGSVQKSAIDAVAYGYATTDIDAGLMWVRVLPEGVAKRDAMVTLVDALAVHDVQRSIAFVSALPAGLQHDELISRVVQRFAESDLPGAVAWLQSHAGSAPESAAAAIVKVAARCDPRAAINLATQFVRDPQLAAVLTEVAQVWGSQDALSALKWGNQQLAGDRRDDFATEVIAGLAATSPGDAARLAADLNPGDLQNRAVEKVIESWAKVDPDAAARWVMTLSGLLRDIGVQQVMSSWAATDPTAASAWLTSLSTDRARALAIQVYIDETATTYPAMAAPWAAMITEREPRNVAVEKVAEQWARTDRAAAEAWLARIGYPDQKRNALLAGSRGQ